MKWLSDPETLLKEIKSYRTCKAGNYKREEYYSPNPWQQETERNKGQSFKLWPISRSTTACLGWLILLAGLLFFTKRDWFD